MCTRVTSFADENFRFPANLTRHAHHVHREPSRKINYPIICGTVEKLRVETTSGCVLPFCFPTDDTRPTAPRHIGREIVSHKIESYREICERLIPCRSRDYRYRERERLQARFSKIRVRYRNLFWVDIEIRNLVFLHFFQGSCLINDITRVSLLATLFLVREREREKGYSILISIVKSDCLSRRIFSDTEIKIFF